MRTALHRVLVWLTALGLVFSAVALLFAAPAVIAQTGGDSGNGKGCKGATRNDGEYRWCAVYGAGWYLYPVSGSGPSAGFRDPNVKWSGVNGVAALCSGLGADTVVTYVIKNGQNGSWKSYNYGVNGTTNDQSTAGWITNGDAKSRFDNRLGGSGLVWGTNVGWFCYADQSHWGVESYTGIKKADNVNEDQDSGWGKSEITALPKETLYWKHTLKATGARIDKTVNWNLAGSGFASDFNPTLHRGSITAASGITANKIFAEIGKYPGANSAYTVYTVAQRDVGNTICQYVTWTPEAWNDATDGSSAQVCAKIPYLFTLTPTINSSIPETAAAGTSIGTVSGLISNSGPTKSYDNTIWQLTRMYVDAGTGIPGDTPDDKGVMNGTAPCATMPISNPKYNGDFLAGSGVRCASLLRGSGAVPTAGEPVSSPQFIIDDALTVGTRVCFVLSVRDRAHNDSQWQHSEPRCITISKRPKVQVIGGDLIVGRGYNSTGSKVESSVMTSTNAVNSNGKTYGSWVQYGIVASGRIIGTASASGFAGGASSGNLCLSLSKLSFVNTRPDSTPPSCDVDQIGRYAMSTPSPATALAAHFPTGGATVLRGSVNTSVLAKNTTYTGDGSPISLSSSAELGKGEWIVINAPTSDVRITSDLRYTSALLSNVSELPQMVIIARNISIAESVGRIDAWLVGYGTGLNGFINTCDTITSAAPSTLRSGLCFNRLEVNGPVIANRLYLYRTGGAGPIEQSGEPAEVFRVRPDAYAWITSQQIASMKVQTVITKELPPRF